VSDRLVERLGAVVRETARVSPRVLVAVDGPDAAGKTTLADALAHVLAPGAGPVAVLRASMDDFHRPRADRYRRGELSAEGYYRDAFDVDAFVDACAHPFRSGADAVRLRSFAYRTDTAPDAGPVPVARRAVLVVDGVFLLRPELAPLWTVSIHLRVPAAESLRRALTRDVDLMGSADEVRRRYLARYLPAQAIYRDEADPESVADIVIDNESVHAPRVLRDASRGGSAIDRW
jgi:uridine kinase